MGDRPPTTRRRVLLAAGAAVTCSAGCTGASDRDGRRSTTIAILAAGSLQNALANGLRPAVDVPVEIEAHGSAAVARMIDEGQRDPDIVSVADVALFEEPLSPSWHAVFTSNSVVIAYNPDTTGGERLADAGSERWYEPMLDGNVAIGRTDPDQDPLGYRALFMLELASRYYDGASDLGAQILERDQIYPETSLISQFETGSIDAAIAYRNMAVERGYDYIELPDQIDLSNPQYAEDWYSRTSYTLPSGQAVQGGVISYGSTIRHASDAAVSVFGVHTTGAYLEEHGYLLRDQFPLYTGSVPRRVRAATDRSDGNQSRLGGPTDAVSSAVSDITVLV
ncbi:ABC-type transport system periplasmic substrate-binding protein (probable substrate sulfate/thiosulfate/molybdate) [Natronomonas moolapensis 8.8.11]|uniref:ABC-type transport system periplasmic substrate-binding protein (Probable substrate sulfate/thiosulfate/molybdate) n=1 Tax=Natronomonas moolapensis (strain DSM 18674 / CECT 7526 / JCM 14361 / 8.8.11) TaxID=268739 RepID=M1XN86_NATM8|nr:extracellular solute-binding protein [Natronomonas moolapensis]CCQ35349.1 ABC-type transport system periplasmic substrate-binding protein (probable substrate sulfate/thiosulfate/molybdate) [Natronomonas moolapensis 8.8.11]